jgi:tetratricopeptide (TPR) repeat protein
MSQQLSKRSILIVDHDTKAVEQQRRLFQSMGATVVDVAISVDMAMMMLRLMPYDLIVISYDMGARQKTGLQLIEEARREGLAIHKSAIVVAVNDQPELKYAALINAPDLLIKKPLHAADVSRLIEKLSRIKRAVAPVEHALNEQEWESALLFIAKLQTLYPALYTYLNRLRGYALLSLNRLAEALACFDEVYQQKGAVWSALGKGVVLNRMGRFDEAKTYLSDVLDKTHYSADAFEELALCHSLCGDAFAAFMLLQRAALLQPGAVTVQLRLAEEAAFLGEFQDAIKAYEEAIRLGKHSALLDVSAYLGLIKIRIAALDPKNISDAEIDAVLASIDQVEYEFKGLDARFAVQVYRAMMRYKLRQSAMAKDHLQKAATLLSKMDQDEHLIWSSWLQEAIEVNGLELALPGPSKKEEPPAWLTLYRKGVDSSSHQENVLSLAYLKKANALVPDNLSVLLAYGETCIRQGETLPVSELAPMMCALHSVPYGSLTARQEIRVRLLLKQFSALVAPEAQIKSSSSDKIEGSSGDEVSSLMESP